MISSNNSKDLIKIGKIKEPFGLKGHVRVFLFSDDYSWFDQIKKFIVSRNGEQRELAIESFRLEPKGAVVLFHEIKNRNLSEEITGGELFIEKSFFKAKDTDRPFLIELLNFKVIDRTVGEIGFVHQFNSNGAQDLLVVALASQQDVLVEIPFVDEYVLKLDRDSQVIEMDLPEGLLDINLKD